MLKNIENSFAKIVVVPVVRIWAHVRQINLIWLTILNRKAIRLYRKYFHPLSEHDLRALRALKKDGIFITHLDDIFPGQNMLSVLQSYASGEMDHGKTIRSKDFLKFFWDRKKAEMDLENPFLSKFMISRHVFGVANAYFGMATKLYNFTLNATVPVPLGSPENQSQRFHRDPEDKKTCKVFVYLNDVDEGAGPFKYIAGSQYGGRWSRVAPSNLPRGIYPDNAELKKSVPEVDFISCVGRAGTVIFCDTQGIHKGGYATTGERVMFTGGFYSSASIRPIMLTYPEGFGDNIKKLDPLVQFALTPHKPGICSKLFFRYKKMFHAPGSARGYED